MIAVKMGYVDRVDIPVRQSLLLQGTTDIAAAIDQEPGLPPPVIYRRKVGNDKPVTLKVVWFRGECIACSKKGKVHYPVLSRTPGIVLATRLVTEQP